MNNFHESEREKRERAYEERRARVKADMERGVIKIKSQWWWLKTTYGCGVICYGNTPAGSDDECIESAKKTIATDNTIESVVAYRCDLPEGESLGYSYELFTCTKTKK